jgi:hypothetical protein
MNANKYSSLRPTAHKLLARPTAGVFAKLVECLVEAFLAEPVMTLSSTSSHSPNRPCPGTQARAQGQAGVIPQEWTGTAPSRVTAHHQGRRRPPRTTAATKDDGGHQGLAFCNPDESLLTGREYTPPVMADFQSFTASLASCLLCSIILPSESTNGGNGRSEERRRFPSSSLLECAPGRPLGNFQQLLPVLNAS